MPTPAPPARQPEAVLEQAEPAPAVRGPGALGGVSASEGRDLSAKLCIRTKKPEQSELWAENELSNRNGAK